MLAFSAGMAAGTEHPINPLRMILGVTVSGLCCEGLWGHQHTGKEARREQENTRLKKLAAEPLGSEKKRRTVGLTRHMSYEP